MTRYEQELRKLFDGSGLMDRPQYSERNFSLPMLPINTTPSASRF